MRNYVLLGLAVAFLLLTAFYFYETNYAPISYVQEPTPVACTDEAKICPDGSSVGRTGPNCEFTECPIVTEPQRDVPATTSVTTEWSLNIAGTQNEVTILPTSIEEDSRCPKDVMCIQAGTVRVRTVLTNGNRRQEVVMTMGTPVNFAGKYVLLRSVLPATDSKVPIIPSDYKLHYEVTTDAPSKEISVTGILEGHMTLTVPCPSGPKGATCKPTEAMYAAREVSVFTQDKKTLVTTLAPNQDGQFSAPLAVGSYYLELTNPVYSTSTTGLPRTLAIENARITRIDVSVDMR